MKIDAKIKILQPKGGEFEVGEVVTIPVYLDNMSDFDDVISDVENEIWTRYGVTMIANVDFEIENQDEICDEFDNADDMI